MVESGQSGLRRRVCPLYSTVHRPLATVLAHREDLDTRAKVVPKEALQIGTRRLTLGGHIVAPYHLVGNEQVLARWGETSITVGGLNDTCYALGVQAVHDASMRQYGDVAEEMHLEATCLAQWGGYCSAAVLWRAKRVVCSITIGHMVRHAQTLIIQDAV